MSEQMNKMKKQSIAVATSFNPYYCIMKKDEIKIETIGRTYEKWDGGGGGNDVINKNGKIGTLTVGYPSHPHMIQVYDWYNHYMRKEETAKTLKTTEANQGSGNLICTDFDVRRLTPRECFRLMGIKDEDFDRIKDDFSDSALYHMAGDSIVTSCLMSIFGTMAEDNFNTEKTINEKLLKGVKDE